MSLIKDTHHGCTAWWNLSCVTLILETEGAFVHRKSFPYGVDAEWLSCYDKIRYVWTSIFECSTAKKVNQARIKLWLPTGKSILHVLQCGVLARWSVNHLLALLDYASRGHQERLQGGEGEGICFFLFVLLASAYSTSKLSSEAVTYFFTSSSIWIGPVTLVLINLSCISASPGNIRYGYLVSHSKRLQLIWTETCSRHWPLRKALLR